MTAYTDIWSAPTSQPYSSFSSSSSSISSESYGDPSVTAFQLMHPDMMLYGDIMLSDEPTSSLLGSGADDEHTTDYPAYVNGSMNEMLDPYNPLTIDAPYLGYYFATFRAHYYLIHGYLSLLICIFGIIANFLNIIVLTR